MNLCYSIVSTAGRTTVEPGRAASILESMQARPAWDEVQVASLEFRLPVLQIAWCAPHGYLMQCFDDSRPSGDLLCQSRFLSEPCVFMDLGGQTQELWPVELFVSFNLAEAAFEHFLAHGAKKPESVWIGIGEFPRLTVAAIDRERTGV